MARQLGICVGCGRIRQIFDRIDTICYSCFAKRFKSKPNRPPRANKEEKDEAVGYHGSCGSHIDIRV